MIKTANIFLVTLLSGGIAHAATADSLLPQPKTEDGVTWISGGIGKTQADAFRKEARHYPLALEFVLKPAHKGARAEFTADIPVVIRDAHGKVLVRAESAGPFMLLKLPEGRYTVVAEHGDEKLERHVVVGRAHHRLVFEWPARHA
jgi:hypothetical protein